MQMVREAYSSGHLLRTTHARDTTPHPHATRHTHAAATVMGRSTLCPGPSQSQSSARLFFF
eukprot:scaffold14097_cov107-Isochrysis_galbana.AAC.2